MEQQLHALDAVGLSRQLSVRVLAQAVNPDAVVPGQAFVHEPANHSKVVLEVLESIIRHSRLHQLERL